MKLSFRLIVIGIVVLPFGLTGCGGEAFPAYSTSVTYGVRQDPILMEPGAKLGDERYDPDVPGQFPIMRFDAIFKPESPYYAKSEEIKKKEGMRDPTTIAAKDREELAKALEAVFGTPAKPTVAGLDDETKKKLMLDDDTLAKGSTRYRIHCLHCHGVPGDGRGPTARWINPHPRDFRAGLFKFQSVNQSDGKTRPPTRADLLRTLSHGIEGTAMPSFRLLEDKELDWLVSYVIHLSLRGNAELDTIKYNFNFANGALAWKPAEEEADPADPAEAVKLWTKLA